MENGHFSIRFASSGSVGGAFNVYSRITHDAPWRYAVDAGASVTDDWDVAADSDGNYDLEVFGANGFYRRFVGNVKAASSASSSNPDVAVRYDKASGNIGVTITNYGRQPCTAIVSDKVYKNEPDRRHLLAPGQSVEDYRLLQASAQWYDITVEVEELPGYLRHFAGHLETGRDSTSDPAMGFRTS